MFAKQMLWVVAVVVVGMVFWAGSAQALNLNVDGLYELTGTTSESYDNVYVGSSAEGTLNIKDSASLTAVSSVDSGSTHPILIGNNYLGTVNLSGGTLTAINGETWIGWWTTGVLNISGGTANLKRVVIYDGQINISAGTLTSTEDLQIDWDEIPSLLAISGGTANLRGIEMGNAKGTVTLTGGTLNLGTGGIYGHASSTINLGGGTVKASATWSSARSMKLTGTGGNVTFDPNGFDITLSGALSSTGGLIVNATGGTGSLILSVANTYTGDTLINAGTLKLGNDLAIQNSALDTSGAGTLDVTTTNTPTFGGLLGGNDLQLTANVTDLTLNLGTGVTKTFFGALSSATAGMTLTKTGGGTQILSGANLYTGATTVSAGTLKAGSTAAFGTNSAVTLANIAGAVLDIAGFNNSIGSLTGGGALGGNVTLGAATLTVGGDGTSPAAYAGVISSTGSPTTSLIKEGAGILTLTATNTYTGATTINGGALKISAADNLGDSTQATNSINLGAATLESTSGTYDLGINRTVTLTGAGTIQSDAGTLTVSGAVTNGANLLTVAGAGDTTISGVIGSGAGGLTKDGGGTLTLTVANTYTGDTLINAGTLKLGNNLSIQNSALDTSGAGALDATTTNTPTFGGLLGGNNLQMPSNVTDLTLNLGTGVTKTYSGALGSATPGMTLTKTGSGTQVLAGANTYTGATTVSAGILKAGIASVPNTSGAFGNNSAVTLADAAGVALDIAGYNTQIGSLTGGGGSGGNVTLGGATLTVGDDGTSPPAYAGKISGTGGRLTKTGGGILTLTAANLYTGATTVSNGTLLVNGSLDFNSTVTVAGGATLGGTGTIGGATIISGHHTPGTSAGIQTFGNDLTYNAGSDVTWELVANISTQGSPGSEVFDQVVVGGGLNFDGTTTLNLVFNAGGSAVDWTDALWNTSQSWLVYDVDFSTGNITNLTLAGTDWADSNKVLLSAAHPDMYFYRSLDGADVMLNYLLPGDANLDHFTDFLDYGVVATNYNVGSTWTQGNVSGDGKVDFLDYGVIATNYGSHVPEPATLALLGLGGLGLLLSRKRK